MADISKITLPNGSEYNFKDTVARNGNPSPATTAPGNVASSSAVGTSTNYARQDHTHGITLATGDQNGQVKIAGTNVNVKGLGDVAYTDDGSTSVTSHDASGSVLSFTAVNAQPVKSLVLNLEPTQNLNGYSNPWAGGAGKNLIDLDAFTAGGIGTDGLPDTNGDRIVHTSPIAIDSSQSYTISAQYSESAYDLRIIYAVWNDDTLVRRVANVSIKNTAATLNVSGGNKLYICLYCDQSHPIAQSSVSELQLEIGTTKTTYEPYSNICPITGYDAVNVERGNCITFDNVTWTVGYRFSETGELVAQGGFRYSSPIKVTAGTWYYVYNGLTTTSRATRFHAYDANGAWLRQLAVSTLATIKQETVELTIASDVKYIRISTGTSAYSEPISLALNEAVTEPVSTIYPISLSSAGTVYGGTLDVTNGELTVDREILTFDGSSDEYWVAWSNGKAYYYVVSASFVSDTNMICDSYDWKGQTGSAEQVAALSVGSFTQYFNNNICFRYDDTGTNLTAFKAALADSPIHVVVRRATELKYMLTPTEVTTLLGQNTIWMDAEGTLEVTYEDVVSPIKYTEVGELGSAAVRNANDEVVPDDTLPTGKAVSNYTPSHAQNGIYYGTCKTAAGTAAKVIELVDPTGFELNPGVMIAVKFTATNTASNVTFNVEGTGAKHIWYNASVLTGSSSSTLGYANRTYFYVYDGTYWVIINKGFIDDNTNTVPAAQCETAAATAAKVATCTNHTLTANTYCHFNIRYANTAKSAITMNVDSSGAKPIYINGAASSSSNYTLPAGTYIAFYNGTYWNFRTDGLLPASISGTVNGHTLYADVPEDAAFTDTTDLGSMTGTLGVNQGGTGATSASLARTNLGLGTAAILGYETTVASDTNLPTGNAVMNLKSSLTVDGVKFNTGTSIIHYCESSTAAGTAAKTATCSNFIKEDGAVVYVKFAYANTASSPTLNISGTGAANIRYRNANITSSYLAANEVYCFVYYGGYYHMVGDVATSATTAQIQSAVDSWLDEHVSDNTIVYESSLTHTVITSTTDITW